MGPTKKNSAAVKTKRASFLLALISLLLTLVACVKEDEAPVVSSVPTTDIPTQPPPPIAKEAVVERRLREVGLNGTPLLGDTSISGHLQRLEEGDVSEETLLQYAADLTYLNEYTAENKGPIPTSFWNVRTPEMEANGWNEYRIVRQMAQPDSEPYLQLLTEGYGRFRQFKASEASGEDTALDVALDMFVFVKAYYDAVPFAALTEYGPEIDSEADDLLMIWQSLVAGSTRTNPLTGRPMFSHSFFSRNNVGTMYQYDTG